MAVALAPSFSAGAAEGRTVDDATAESFGRLAGAVLTERTAALVDNKQSDKQSDQQRTAQAGKNKKVRLSSGLARNEDGALSSLRTRKSRLASLGEAYSAADTQVTADKPVVKNGRATVQVTETTTLTYKKVRGDEPATTGFTAHHEASFARTPSGTWELTGIQPKDEGPRAINQPVAAPAAQVNLYPSGTPASTSWPARPQPKKMSGTGYNYAAMASYAEKYWRNYNPAYRKFNAAGGDCTNFISQALRAGGWKDAPGPSDDNRSWYYATNGQSVSWVGANEWSWFTLSSKRATNLANVYQMDVGDILQLDFDRDGSKDHSMITTYRSRAGVPYMTYHSTNTYRKSVASIIASNPDAVYFAYRT
ncbi:amidase domain-containing protein [Streptomyces sp. URMC 123]|uniref:amidase domain-containing protein n=1 Tax=Streptomyces sp. URMC 123 TaxID=3423403 RepID=UPI003F19B6AB